MNLAKKEKIEFNNIPYVGFMECSVVSINPDREELIKLLGVSEEKQEEFKEREYMGETEEGQTKFALDFWLKDVVTERLFNYRVTLIDKKQTNKDGTSAQYISCTGGSSWADSPENLQTWFTHFTTKDKEVLGEKSYREANVGEAQLYGFLRTWMSGVNFNDLDVNILIDWNKLMRGNIKDLRELVGSEYVGTVVAMAEVRIKDSEDGPKYYQGVYNKAVLPGYLMKTVKNCISNKNWDNNKNVKRFVDELQGEYGSKNVFVLDTLRQFDESMSIASTDKVISEDSLDY